MPQMGESLSEGTVTKWFKKVGERVERDEPLFEISTDKVDTEIPAPASGILEKILVQEGETVAVETVVAVIDSGEPKSQAPRPDDERTQPAVDVPASTESGGHFKAVQEATILERKPAEPVQQGQTAAAETDSKSNVLSPAVLSLAARNQIPMSELLRIPGTGAGGRIRKKDVKRYIEQHRPPAPPQPPGYAAPPPSYPWPAYPIPPNPFAVLSPYPSPPVQALVPAPPSAPYYPDAP